MINDQQPWILETCAEYFCSHVFILTKKLVCIKKSHLNISKAKGHTQPSNFQDSEKDEFTFCKAEVLLFFHTIISKLSVRYFTITKTTTIRR